MPDRPLLVTSDPDLLDELLRLCAAAGTEADVAHNVAAARLSWSTPPLIVVGSDVAAAAVTAKLPRRAGVVLVGLGHDDDLWDVANDIGADSVVALPRAQSWLVNRLGETTDIANGAGLVVAVAGGRGGAGATTLATVLALTGVDLGLRCLLVDADPLGGGIDLALGEEACAGLRWPDLTTAGGRMNGAALLEALPNVHGLSVLSAGRGDALTVPAQAMRSVTAAATRMSDLVVVDLPRYIDDAAEEVLAVAAVTLLVVPAEVRAVAAAGRVAVSVGLTARDVRVVVRGPAPSGLTATVVADSLGLPLAGWLPAEPRLDETFERGEPPGRGAKSPLAAFCRELLTDLTVGRRRAA
ncbi:MAG: septum site-determining protein Ssd [Sporichthyaceae bacterium]